MEEKEGEVLAVVNAVVVVLEGKPQIHCEIHGDKNWIMSAMLELLKPMKEDFKELLKNAGSSGTN